MIIPLKDCDQCSHYRGNYCYGFGVAKKVVSTAEAIICGKFTPLGQVQIGPLESLAGQLKAIQIPDAIISTLKLADLAVTAAKLGISSVSDSKVAAGAGILESKLSLDFGTDALNTLINILDTEYGAHDHSVADPTKVDFNNLLNIDPLDLSGDISLAVGKKLILDKDADGNNFFCSPHDTYASLYIENVEVLRLYSTTVSAMTGFKFANNKLLILGYPDGASLYHTGTGLILKTVIGSMYLQSVTSIVANICDSFIIRDTDDENAELFVLDSNARTFKVGIATDPIESTFTGNIAVSGTVDGVDVSELAAKYDALLMIGSGNAQWVPFKFMGFGMDDTAGIVRLSATDCVIENLGGTDFNIVYRLAISTTKGSLDLHVDDIRMQIRRADADDYINTLTLKGIPNSSELPTQIDQDPTDRNSAGAFTWTRDPSNVSGYVEISLSVSCIVADAFGLIIYGFQALCHYE